MALEKLWTEKYRPSTINEYVFKDVFQKDIIQNWINTKTIPNIIFSGSPGTGKTTMAKILVNELGVQDYDIMFTNASKEGRRIEWLNDVLSSFCQTIPFGDFKVIILDEADFLNCLWEEESILLYDGSFIKLKDMTFDQQYNIKSFNMATGEIEEDTAELISDGLEDVYEVTLEDGRIIYMTNEHPFIIQSDNLFNEMPLNNASSDTYVLTMV